MNRARTPARDAEVLYGSAMDAERRGEYDSALQMYVRAGSAFLALGDRAAATRAVERAEKIKAARKDVAPVMRNRFSEEEQRRVVKRGKIVNGTSLPLLDEPPSRSNGSQCVDAAQPALSAEQIAENVQWRRPEDVFDDASVDYDELAEEDIVQRVSDCTLHASIVVCLAHKRKFGSEDVIPRLRPLDPSGKPKISTDGAYELCIHFNGAQRRIAFDSRLPFQPDGTLMCLAPQTGHNIWPSLIEKAYLKLFGGYEFMGSTSAADLHTLLGWIPEHIELKRRSFQREQAWSRLARAFHKGIGLMTVGTDDRATTSIGKFRPMRSHCYAIVDVSLEEDLDRWVTILDSLNYSNHPANTTQGVPEATRAIRMSWHDLCTAFDSLYISWDPRVFPQKLSYNGAWRSSYLSETGKADSAHQVFHLAVDPVEGRQSDLWVLLTRHRTNTRLVDEYISLQVELEDFVSSDEAASSTKTRGVYTNNHHVLIRTSAPPQGGMFSVTTSYDSQQNDVGYTLDVFSYARVRWDQTIRRMPYEDVLISGVFNSRTGGGNHTLPTYMYNPQYRLTVPHTRSGLKSRVALTVQTARELPVNVTVVWGKGERVFDLTKSDILASSGAYSYGYASTSKDVSAGTYTVIVSAFEPTHQGAFTLKIASTTRVQLEPIPQEGSGMFMKPIRGEWTTTSQPRYEFTLGAATQVQARLQLQESSPTTMICFALAAVEPESFSYTSELADTPAGVAMPRRTLRAGKYVISPSAEGFGDGAKFRLIIWSDRTAVDIKLAS